MPTRPKTTHATEIARIEQMIEDLEKRLHKLNGAAHDEAAGATDDINDFVSEALAGIMERVRDKTDSMTEQVVDRAAKVGTDAFRRVLGEVENYPLATLAVAAGIGFLLGSARR
jgi:ElaB/YqjD/DUF883 family membrane-anchored ribosome-binding protein